MGKTNFKGKRVLIMGLGINGMGQGAAEWFTGEGAIVTVTDKKTARELQPSLAKLKTFPIRYVLGGHHKEDFITTDIIVRNPDVPKDSPYLEIARKHKIPIIMEDSLFYCLYPDPEKIIGVTGTRGKTTTTLLIAEVLRKGGKKVLVGGNLRGTASLLLLKNATPGTWVILELSSWQLQGFDEIKKSPHIAVFTNIYPDHLNRYPSMDEYIRDKETIFKYQTEEDFLFANHKNEQVRKLAKGAKSKKIWFSQDDIPKNWHLLLLGKHNNENAAAAICVGKFLKIPTQLIQKAIEEFSSIPFRLQEIRKLNGVTYVNDTTSTTPVAGIMALRAYNHKPIVLIAGGNTKNLDLSDFAREMKNSVKFLILLEGTATDELEKAVKLCAPNVTIIGRFSNFRLAVHKARKVARKGEIILLSPGCTSFGMFVNEFDRGEKFNNIVGKL
jgi:UDP-N-acetylmuramoylalanine--D-glutamate ligase